VFGNEKDFWNKGMSVGLVWAGLEIKESPSQLDIVIPLDYLSTRP